MRATGKRERVGRKETRQIEVAEEATGWTVGEKKLETATHLAGGTRRGGPETRLSPRLPMLDTINLTTNLTMILQYINPVLGYILHILQSRAEYIQKCRHPARSAVEVATQI